MNKKRAIPFSLPVPRCQVVLEAGMNHNGDMELARDIIAAAADVGADGVKFQSFTTARLVLPTDSSWEFRQSVELSREDHEYLLEESTKHGLRFLSSACDEDGIDVLADLQASAIKISSFEIDHLSLIAHASSKGLPLILSTGTATLEEIEQAVNVIRKNGNPPLVLLHCVSRYPAPPESCNLEAMNTLRQVFRVPVGYSDHTEGLGAAALAAGMGAAVIEKHFTLNKQLPGPDQSMSADPEEVTRMIRAIREAEAARGSAVIRPDEDELQLAAIARRSLHTTKPIRKGEAFTCDNVDVLRPPTGLAPKHLETVLQRHAARDLEPYIPLQWQDLDP